MSQSTWWWDTRVQIRGEKNRQKRAGNLTVPLLIRDSEGDFKEGPSPT